MQFGPGSPGLGGALLPVGVGDVAVGDGDGVVVVVGAGVDVGEGVAGRVGLGVSDGEGLWLGVAISLLTTAAGVGDFGCT